MARPLRVEYSGAFYHVNNRENSQEIIFKNDRDKEKFFEIITKDRKKNKAREMAIHLARDLSGTSCKDLGLYFGGVSGALITIMYNQVTKEASKSRRLKRRLGKVKKRISYIMTFEYPI